ncbi:hypothetical protein DFJ63DRAFT_24657 [Scheffersomyces coipomensis]|uniref:uncharacterized protein n=1 Tax=Scheffersomyces coipomensis TaxID=1788519 RepID=UPI00315DF3E9
MVERINNDVIIENNKTNNDAITTTTTPKSPLSPLRLSVPNFEINSSKKPSSSSQTTKNDNDNTNENQSTRSPRTHRSSNAPFIPRRRSKDGFDLDFNIPQIVIDDDNDEETKRIPIIKEEGIVGGGENKTVKPTDTKSTKPVPTKADVKKIGELSSLFLDTRKSLQYDFNVADSIKHKEGPDPTHEHKIKISKVSLARAEKVRSMMGVKYFHIQRMYEASLAHPGHMNLHPGVEGVYNPIQIIRNRELRIKYHDYPKDLSMKSIPLACNVFSKNNGDSDHPWKLIWAIELKEFLGDFTFRANHWHELVNAKGELWFPPSNSSSTVGSNDSKIGLDLKQRLHDKLFSSEESVTKKTSNTSSSKKQRRTSTATTGSADSDKLKITRTKSPASKRIKDRVKRHTRKFYNGTSSSATDEDEANIINYTSTNNSSKDPIKQQMFKKVSISPEVENDEDASMENNSISIHESKSAIATSVPSFRVDSTEDQNESLDISNVMFTPMDKKDITVEHREDGKLVELEKSETEHAENGGASPAPLVQVTSPPLDAKELEFQVMLNDFTYFERVINLKTNYLLKIYPNYTHIIGTKLSNILHRKLYTVFHATTKISDDYLPEYEDLYQGFSNEVKSVAHMINDDYSVRIDNLLSNSDRSISEINASLTLDLRKINEKLDKLDNSLFGNSVTNRLKESHLKIKDGDNYTMLYFCLENFIVILLRIVWIIVNLYKGVELTVKFVWKIIRFILY